MIKNVLKWHHPALETICTPVDLQSTDDLQSLKDLVDTFDDLNMTKPTALGLSLPQIGITKRAFCMKTWMKQGLITWVIVNPVLEEMSQELEIGTEGCLSFPWLKGVKVIRPAVVGGYCFYPDGERLNFRLNAIEGRVFQHEYEHLQGITIDHHRRAARAARGVVEQAIREEQTSELPQV